MQLFKEEDARKWKKKLDVSEDESWIAVGK